ncbi:unnamed protein product [Microthlaspi erraticum]|uniref:Uncharacterized protein n=1 Tax=Microthlaspi erraticum TaxID=1685480 RepID=A0A6D2IKV5_9BRAS|nr:unnamed protein product [Microthlaspi erraticum]
MDLRISQATSRVTFHDSSVADYHQQWMIQFSRNYSNESEKQMRLKVFKKNLKFIEDFNNNENHSYKLGVNEFTDWTQEEFLATQTGGLSGINLTSSSEVVNETMPSWNWNVSNVVAESKDWTKEGAVTPVKSQQGCGKLAETINCNGKGLTRIVQGKLLPLSEQQIVDCDKINGGCIEGRATDAYEYIVKNGGITTDLIYPYQAKEGSCRSNISPAMKISGFGNVPENNERALLEAVSRQPVSVGIDARSASLLHYKEGVYNERDCGIDINHSLTLVGYGTTKEGIKYWLAKNSWGETWGEKGYIRFRRDVEWPEGMCGLAQSAVYPVM